MKQFIWTHYHNTCIQCGDCIATCGKALRLSSLQRIVRDKNKCTQCETCSTICDSIHTEFKEVK